MEFVIQQQELVIVQLDTMEVVVNVSKASWGMVKPFMVVWWIV